MLEDLDTKSAVPLYDQIAVRVRMAIATGELSAGDALPSVRDLSGRLRINPATVTQAYRALEDDGFVERRQGAGTYVRSVSSGIRMKERTAQARRLAREMLAQAARFGLTRDELTTAIGQEMNGGIE